MGESSVIKTGARLDSRLYELDEWKKKRKKHAIPRDEKPPSAAFVRQSRKNTVRVHAGPSLNMESEHGKQQLSVIDYE